MRTCSECGNEFSKPDKARLTCSRACGQRRAARLYQETTRERFEAKVDRSGECHVWTAKRLGSLGYGRFQNQLAHRVAWTLARGEIPEGLLVCHKCDNPICVRIDHLFLGSQTENMKDMVSKNRQAKGKQKALAKLTDDLVLRLRNRHVEFPGMTQKQIGEALGVSQPTVSVAARGLAWRHVDG